MTTINLKKDFSSNPFGALHGEAFLLNLLLPTIEKNPEKLIVIDLDSDFGLGSSFLISAFCLIVKHKNIYTGINYTFDEIKCRIKFLETDSYIKDDISFIWSNMYKIENQCYHNSTISPRIHNKVELFGEEFFVSSISDCKCFFELVNDENHIKKAKIKDCRLLNQ